MNWLNENDIQEFLNKYDYDICESGDARWIDQKCTADVVCVVSDCILQFAEKNPNKGFTSKDIWHFEYAIKTVESIFKKPNPDEKKAEREYDKFFGQPMKMLAYSGVLIENKKGKQNVYTINDFDILRYISIRERNALNFLQLYISKVLNDSSIKYLFDELFEKQTKETYDDLKDGFAIFLKANTKIGSRGSDGKQECGRIFSKVVNPLAFKCNKRGTEKGHISKHKITFDMLMYNRDNFRDIYANKPKELTRRQYAEQQGISLESRYTQYLSQKAKRFVKAFNIAFRNQKSEVYDERHNDDVASHIHHIFPEAIYHEISTYYENLIALTPTQHLNYAHPFGNTGRIDTAFQNICLIAKAGIIKENLTSIEQEHIYEFKKFMYILFVGFDKDIFKTISEMDFDSTIREINLAYA